ncbi:putative ribonuclease H-like domain-containing protein [Tanacetum coccineum]
MSTQQDIYAAGSENRPSMLNKENYVPWSSLFLWYAKSRPNGKLIYNSIINGPYVRRMIPKPGDQNRKVPVNETFHEQTDDQLTKKELKQEIWLRVQQMMKGSDIRIQKKKAKLFNEWETFTSTDGESVESYYHRFSKLMNDFKRNKHFPEKTSSNLEFLNNLQPEWSRHVTIVHQKKELNTTNYTSYQPLPSTYMQQPQPNNNKYNPQPSFNQNYMQQLMPNPEDITDPTTAMNMALVQMAKNPNRNGDVVAARAEGNVIGNNSNQIRCYNCRGLGHLARNCTVKSRRRDAAYLQTQLLIAQKEEAGIQLQAEEFDLMVAAADLDEIEEANANSELLEPIPEPHQVQQNDSNVISEVSSMEQDGGTVDQHLATVEETHAYFESLYNNLAIEVEKVNSVNRKMKETNADLTTELARYKNQEKCFEIRQHKYDKLERCYQNPFYLKQAQQKQQSLYDGKVLLEKHDPPAVHDSEETLQLAKENRLKMKQLNKEIK